MITNYCRQIMTSILYQINFMMNINEFIDPCSNVLNQPQRMLIFFLSSHLYKTKSTIGEVFVIKINVAITNTLQNLVNTTFCTKVQNQNFLPHRMEDDIESVTYTVQLYVSAFVPSTSDLF